MFLILYKENPNLPEELFNSLTGSSKFRVEKLEKADNFDEPLEDVIILDPENMKDEDYKIIPACNRIVNLWNISKLKSFLIDPDNELPSLSGKKILDVVYSNNLNPSEIKNMFINLLKLADRASNQIFYIDREDKLLSLNKLHLAGELMSLLARKFPQLKQIDRISRNIIMSKFFLENFPNNQVGVLENLGKICAELALLRYRVQTGQIILGNDGEESLSEITSELEKIHEYLDKVFTELFDNMFFNFISQFVLPAQLESNLIEDFLKIFIPISSKIDAACRKIGFFKTGKKSLKKLLRQLGISHRVKKETLGNYKTLYKKNLKTFRMHPLSINRSLIDEFAALVIFLESLRRTIESQLELMNVFANVPKIVQGIGELSELIFVDLNFLISRLRKLYQSSPAFVQIRGDITLSKFEGPGGLIEKWEEIVRLFREYSEIYKDERINDVLDSISKILSAFHHEILRTLLRLQRDVTVLNIIEYTIQTGFVIPKILSGRFVVSEQALKKLYREFTIQIINMFKKLLSLLSEENKTKEYKNTEILAVWEYLKIQNDSQKQNVKL